jgi:hypothetical protein
MSIVVVSSGGLPVTESPNGFPYYIADNGFGIPVTFVSQGGYPLGGVSRPPAWVYAPLQSNPPDIYGDLTLDLEWKKAGNIIVPATSKWSVNRSTGDTQVDSSGNWSTFGSNLWARSDRGAGTWEARTNSVRNNTMQGVVAGSPGTTPNFWQVQGSSNGLTRTVIGFGTENGIDYIDMQFQGTCTGSSIPQFKFESANSIAAANGQTWTSSVFLKLIGGSFGGKSVTFTNWVFDASSNFLGGAGSIAIQSLVSGAPLGTQRIVMTGTISNASAAFIQPLFYVGTSVGDVVDFTLRIGWPQIEQGVGASPPILTSSGAGARQATSARRSLSDVVLGGQYTLWAEGEPGTPVNSSQPQGLFAIDDGSANNRAALRRHGGDALFEILMASGGTTSFDNVTTGVWQQGSIARMIGMFATGDQQMYATGNALSGQGTAATLPVNPTALTGGSAANGGSQFLNGNFRRYAIWLNQRVPNTQAPAMVN